LPAIRDAESTTVIAIHGGRVSISTASTATFAAMLGGKHVVIFYDQRGGGKSELPADIPTRLFASRQIRTG
jgi:hypothetical protein